MKELILTAVGKDKPGIVAAVTKVLLDNACNIEDSEMAIVRGTFAMILSLAAPPKLSENQLLKKLAPLARRSSLSFTVKKNTGRSSQAPAAGTHAILSVYGGDKPGIVHAVAQLLSKHRVNITQVDTKLIETQKPSLYIMVLEVDLPPALSSATLEEALVELQKQLGVDISFRPHEASVL